MIDGEPPYIKLNDALSLSYIVKYKILKNTDNENSYIVIKENIEGFSIFKKR